MDLKNPNTQKLLLAALSVLLIAYFWHSKVFEPRSLSLDQKRSEYETMMTNLKTVELKAKSLTGLRKEYDKLLDRYQTIEQLLPEEQQVPEFLLQLHSATMMSQSVVKEIQPNPAIGESFYNTAEYGIKFTGTYHELGRFFSAVANFPFITNVSRVDLKGLNPNEITRQRDLKKPGGDYDKRTLVADFYLSTYYVKPGEKLKGVTF